MWKVRKEKKEIKEEKERARKVHLSNEMKHRKLMYNPSAKRAAEKKKRGEKDCRIARTEFNLRTLPLFDTDLRVAK